MIMYIHAINIIIIKEKFHIKILEYISIYIYNCFLFLAVIGYNVYLFIQAGSFQVFMEKMNWSFSIFSTFIRSCAYSMGCYCEVAGCKKVSGDLEPSFGTQICARYGNVSLYINMDEYAEADHRQKFIKK